MSRVKAVADGFNWLIYACHLVAALLVLPIMAFLIGLDVTMRYFVSAPLSWVQELTGLLLIIAVMLGLSYSWTRRVHVRMEMLYERGGTVFRRLGDLLTAICGIMLFGMIGWQAWRDIPFMRTFGERSEELGLPLWPFRLFLLAMCVLVCVQLLFSLALSLQGLRPRDAR